MNKRFFIKIIFFVVSFVVVFFADRILKNFLIKELSKTGEFSFGEFLTIHVFPNKGIAFGIPVGGALLYVFLVVVFVILLVLYIKYLRNDKVISVAALGMVIGGALGNIVDRIRFGYVVDYVDFHVFPIFNLADLFIVIGILILVWRMVFENKDN